MVGWQIKYLVRCIGVRSGDYCELWGESFKEASCVDDCSRGVWLGCEKWPRAGVLGKFAVSVIPRRSTITDRQAVIAKAQKLGRRRTSRGIVVG